MKIARSSAQKLTILPLIDKRLKYSISGISSYVEANYDTDNCLTIARLRLKY